MCALDRVVERGLSETWTKRRSWPCPDLGGGYVRKHQGYAVETGLAYLRDSWASAAGV